MVEFFFTAQGVCFALYFTSSRVVSPCVLCVCITQGTLDTQKKNTEYTRHGTRDTQDTMPTKYVTHDTHKTRNIGRPKLNPWGNLMSLASCFVSLVSCVCHTKTHKTLDTRHTQCLGFRQCLGSKPFFFAKPKLPPDENYNKTNFRICIYI